MPARRATASRLGRAAAILVRRVLCLSAWSGDLTCDVCDVPQPDPCTLRLQLPSVGEHAGSRSQSQVRCRPDYREREAGKKKPSPPSHRKRAWNDQLQDKDHQGNGTCHPSPLGRLLRAAFLKPIDARAHSLEAPFQTVRSLARTVNQPLRQYLTRLWPSAEHDVDCKDHLKKRAEVAPHCSSLPTQVWTRFAARAVID